MKNYAMPLLEAVPQENVRRKELLELIDGFQGFHPIDPELVPPAHPLSGSSLAAAFTTTPDL